MRMSGESIASVVSDLAQQAAGCDSHRRSACARATAAALGTMDTLIVPDVEERGLTLGLDALTPRERDVFVVYDLQLYYEMEGCFADHVPNAPEKFDWLEDVLQRIGDLGSLRAIRQLRELTADGTPHALALCDEYAARNEFRWTCLERYLLNQGIKLKWEIMTGRRDR